MNNKHDLDYIRAKKQDCIDIINWYNYHEKEQDLTLQEQKEAYNAMLQAVEVLPLIEKAEQEALQRLKKKKSGPSIATMYYIIVPGVVIFGVIMILHTIMNYSPW